MRVERDRQMRREEEKKSVERKGLAQNDTQTDRNRYNRNTYIKRENNIKKQLSILII